MIKKTPNPIDKHVGKRLGNAAPDVGYDAAQTWHCARSQVPAGAELREGEEPDRSSRLHQVAGLLQVTPKFFFERCSKLQSGRSRRNVAPSPMPLIHFLATPDGMTLAKAFMRIVALSTTTPATIANMLCVPRTPRLRDRIA